MRAGSASNPSKVGSYLFAQVLFANPISASSGVLCSICSLVLPPGDWDVWGQVAAHQGGSGIDVFQGGFTLTSGAGLSPDASMFNLGSSMGANAFSQNGLVPQRFLVTANTTVYLTGLAFPPSGTLSFSGWMAARNWAG